MAFFKGRKQQVRVLSGVPQGPVLGPTLFNVNIGNTPQNITNKFNLYADDLKLIDSVNAQQGVASI